jgi:hypothetical protein
MRSCAAPGLELRGGEALRCELLVDASGRSSRLPEWLAAEGRPLQGLRREVVDSGLGYATRTIAMPPNWRRDQARRWPRKCRRAIKPTRRCQPVPLIWGKARVGPRGQWTNVGLGLFDVHACRASAQRGDCGRAWSQSGA